MDFLSVSKSFHASPNFENVQCWKRFLIKPQSFSLPFSHFLPPIISIIMIFSVNFLRSKLNLYSFSHHLWCERICSGILNSIDIKFSTFSLQPTLIRLEMNHFPFRKLIRLNTIKLMAIIENFPLASNIIFIEMDIFINYFNILWCQLKYIYIWKAQRNTCIFKSFNSLVFLFFRNVIITWCHLGVDWIPMGWKSNLAYIQHLGSRYTQYSK